MVERMQFVAHPNCAARYHFVDEASGGARRDAQGQTEDRLINDLSTPLKFLQIKLSFSAMDLYISRNAQLEDFPQHIHQRFCIFWGTEKII